MAIEKTYNELFCGVGGFSVGINHIVNTEHVSAHEKWKLQYYNNFEPADKTQWAHGIYKKHFGERLDINGYDSTNTSIEDVDEKTLPKANLIMAGYPCQDYSVSATLSASKGILGKKGVLFWELYRILEYQQTPFGIFENVDNMIKKDKGKHFSIMLSAFNNLGYTVEWRVIQGDKYGFPQRRRRTYLFLYKNDTTYNKTISAKIKYNPLLGEEFKRSSMTNLLLNDGFFAKSFPVEPVDKKVLKIQELPADTVEVSENFKFDYENSGVMKDGVIYTFKTIPKYDGHVTTLGEIMEDEFTDVDESLFIPDNKLYYSSDHSLNHTDEATNGIMSKEERGTWQYIKGAKRIPRKSKSTEHEYIFSEGPIAMIDEYDKPARTMLTSEATTNRSSHLVRDKKTGRIRYLTAHEMNRIQTFPTGWTDKAIIDGKEIDVPFRKQAFIMGNALITYIVGQMEPQLSEIFDNE